MKTVILIICCFLSIHGLSQIDTLDQAPNTENVSAFYIVDKMYTDPNKSATRGVNGAVNFVEILNNRISIICKSPDGIYAQTASIDAIYIEMQDDGAHMFIEALSDGESNSYTYVFEIYTKESGSILVHSRRKRTQNNAYFECHVASEEEKAFVRNYFLENAPKY